MGKVLTTYLHSSFVKSIDRTSIRTIVECGSRDCLDAIALNKFYKPRKIYSFECNPESIPVCERNIKRIPNIVLIPKAVCDVDGDVSFYATDMENSVDRNIGASSLLIHHERNKNGFVQKKELVRGIRLDTFMHSLQISQIDLLCMDLQGAEYIAIQGLGERIRDVRYIISEVALNRSYIGEMNFGDFTRFLKEKGFELKIRIGADALYERV